MVNKGGTNMNRTIRVTGKGKISVRPDLICIIMTLRDIYESYEKSLKESSKQIKVLQDCFEEMEFERKDLKTLSFNIDTQYERYRDKKGCWKEKFLGYEFQHEIKVEFDLDNEMLGKVLKKLSMCDAKPLVRIAYTVKDIDRIKNIMLERAIRDSKGKAEVLTMAAGVKLGEIVNIDYSWGEIEFFSRPMEDFFDCMKLSDDDYDDDSFDIDIEPEDIKKSDTVTVVWAIE